MAIQRVGTSNTFLDWIVKTQELTIRVPEFLDSFEDSGNTVVANTNLNIAHDVNVSENVTVGGNFILVDNVYDDLDVAGNIEVQGTITTTNAEFSNLTIDGTVSLPSSVTFGNVGVTNFITDNVSASILNVYDVIATNTINLLAASIIVSDAIITQNIVNLNTASLDVGTDANIYNALNVESYLVSPNLTATDISVNNVFVTNFDVTSDEIISNDLNSVGNVIVTNGLVTISNTPSQIDTLNVTNAGSAAYLFDLLSGSNPTINVFAGQTIAFNLNVIGHPFLIRETAGGANTSEGLIHISPSLVVSTGLDAQGKVDGTLYWTIPHYLEGSTYVYQCFIHTGAMVGNIAIGQAYPRANDVTTDTLVISANIKEINLTSTLNVGTDANIYGNLTVVGDYSFGDYDFPPGSDLNIETANVTNLIGEANTQIYNTIANSTAAVTVAANVSAFVGFVLALG